MDRRLKSGAGVGMGGKGGERPGDFRGGADVNNGQNMMGGVT